jgi:hypothetical protein
MVAPEAQEIRFSGMVFVKPIRLGHIQKKYGYDIIYDSYFV